MLSPCTPNQQSKVRRSHPAQPGEGFDAPPTLERSGSEHRRAVTSPLPEEEGLGEKVELSLQERRRGRKKPFLMGKSDANERNENSLSNCRVQPALSKKEGRDDFRKAILQ